MLGTHMKAYPLLGWLALLMIQSSSCGQQISENRLRVISYNVQFLPGAAAIANKRPLPEYRAQTIGKLLTQYDVVGLNEAFADEHRLQLLAELKQAWGEAYGEFISPQVDPPRYHGGLVIATKLPIVSSDFHTYTQFSKPQEFGLKADGFVTKGVIHARLATNSDRADASSIDVFVTHLEAQSAKLRPSQYAEMAEFIKSHNASHRPALIMGDFNTLGDQAQLDNPASDYHRMIGNFKAAQPSSSFSDLWLDHGQGPGGTSAQVIPDGGKRIDYIFTLNPRSPGQLRLETEQVSVNRFLDAKVIALSDHNAVEATLQLK
jgi:endonuclease/exonuclease/phosphatase family metal-dependent hydrolase